jgi:hypothetical protein
MAGEVADFAAGIFLGVVSVHPPLYEKALVAIAV